MLSLVKFFVGLLMFQGVAHAETLEEKIARLEPQIASLALRVRSYENQIELLEAESNRAYARKRSWQVLETFDDSRGRTRQEWRNCNDIIYTCSTTKYRTHRTCVSCRPHIAHTNAVQRQIDALETRISTAARNQMQVESDLREARAEKAAAEKELTDRRTTPEGFREVRRVFDRDPETIDEIVGKPEMKFTSDIDFSKGKFIDGVASVTTGDKCTFVLSPAQSGNVVIGRQNDKYQWHVGHTNPDPLEISTEEKCRSRRVHESRREECLAAVASRQPFTISSGITLVSFDHQDAVTLRVEGESKDVVKCLLSRGLKVPRVPDRERWLESPPAATTTP